MLTRHLNTIARIAVTQHASRIVQRSSNIIGKQKNSFTVMTTIKYTKCRICGCYVRSGLSCENCRKNNDVEDDDFNEATLFLHIDSKKKSANIDNNSSNRSYNNCNNYTTSETCGNYGNSKD
jgi:hypothetical protein